MYRRDQAGESVLFPVIGYYGAGRAWLPSNQRVPGPKPNGPARRWAAFYDCLDERIRLPDLQKWFQSEAIAASRTGRVRPGFRIVQQAVASCVPGADDVWFDADREQIVLSIDGQAQPFDNLSAGQRMMLALVADIAIKAVMQNTYLVPEDRLGAEDDPVPRVLRYTPGVILIDELDVHLHPRWQRSVAADLKGIFPGLQFVCTTHSPQVIGEAEPDEIRLLDSFEAPRQSFGMDSNWVLQVLMGADEQDAHVKGQLSEVFRLISEKQLERAERAIQELRSRIGNSEAVQRAASTIERVKVLGR
jgi:predicted ATP-binding protein involved in virulence